MSKTAVREGRETRKPISMRKSLEVLRKELRATAEPETKKEEPEKAETKKVETEKVETKKAEAKKEVPKGDSLARLACLEREVDHLKAENTNLENKLKRQIAKCDELEKRLVDCERFIIKIAGTAV